MTVCFMEKLRGGLQRGAVLIAHPPQVWKVLLQALCNDGDIASSPSVCRAKNAEELKMGCRSRGLGEHPLRVLCYDREIWGVL